MDPDQSDEEDHVQELYSAILDAWNRRSGGDFAALFAANGSMVGFDGSQVTGTDEIAAHLAPIFANHPTPAYVSRVEEVRIVAPGVAILRAVAGLVSPGQDDIVPELNAIQTLVASRVGQAWRAEMLQSTPAQFHGRPELADELTTTLRTALRDARGSG